MSLEDYKKYITDLCVLVYGKKPKEVTPFQKLLNTNEVFTGYFFVNSYVSNGVLNMYCNGVSLQSIVSVPNFPGSVTQIDHLGLGLLCDEMKTLYGATLVSGFQCSF